MKILPNKWCKDRSNPNIKDKLNKAKSEYKKEIFKAWENSWKSYVESIESVPDTGCIARHLGQKT